MSFLLNAIETIAVLGWMPDILERLVKSCAVMLAATGAFFFLNAFIPQVIFIKNTKNTVGINTLMFCLHLTVTCLFLLGSIIWLIESIGRHIGGWSVNDMIITASMFIVNNSINGSGMCYILMTKLKNAGEAKKLGITESEYHEKYLAPKAAA